MNPRLLPLVAALFLAGSVGARQGSYNIIKDRAKELRDQNNAQQGVTAPAPAPARPLTPLEENLLQLRSDLKAIRPNAPATQLTKQQLARDFIAISQGPAKPSLVAANKLAEGVASALSAQYLTQATRERLVKDFNAVLNPAKLTPGQLQDFVTEIQKTFQANDIDPKAAAAIADNARAIASETQKTVAK